MDIHTQFLILFTLICTGYLCKKYRIISNNMNEDLGNLTLLVSLPAMIIYSMSTFSYSAEMMREIATMLAISLCQYFVYILISYGFIWLLGLKGEVRDLAQFITIFANTAFMGFPIAYIFYGGKGLLYMVIFNMFYDVFAWTFGITILGRTLRLGESGWKAKKFKGLLNPCIIAVLIGFTLIITGIKLPDAVTDYLEMLGKISTPLALLFVGSMLADLKLAHMFTDKTCVKSSLFTVVGMPLLVFGLMKLFEISGLFLNIAVLAAAVPAAASTPIVAVKYGSDRYFASKLVLMSTLFSFVTIPLILFILRSINS